MTTPTDERIASLRLAQAALAAAHAEMGYTRPALSTTDPIAAWKAAVAAERRPGRTEFQAVQAALAAHPGIAQAAVTVKTQAVQAPPVVVQRAVRDRWEAAIAERQRRGLTRSAAIALVARELPDLRNEFNESR